MELNDNKLKWFFDKELLQKTVDTCVDKGINLAEVRWFTQPENRVELAKQMAAGRYHIAPPHIIEIPKRDSTEMRKVYCNEPMDRFICAQIGRVYDRMFGGWIHPITPAIKHCRRGHWNHQVLDRVRESSDQSMTGRASGFVTEMS